MRLKLLLLSAAGLALIASPALAVDPPYGGTAVASMTATLKDSAGATIGTVQLHQDAAGVVQVRVDAAGLPAGAHGIHVHAVGRCDGPDFTTAGGHFNPTGRKHGLDSAEGAHGGDLAQVPASFTGTGTHIATTDRLSLTAGPLFIGDADGSALVIHIAPDDQVTDPTGNSGARIACAVLAAPSAAASVPTRTAPLPPATGTGPASSAGYSVLNLVGLAVIVGAAGLGGLRLARKRVGA